MSEAALALRRRIFEAFAADGEPPAVAEGPALSELVDAHVVVLDPEGSVLMAHPFAAPPGGAVVRSGERTWSGNCAWDGFGIVAALGLRSATVSSGEVTVRVVDGEPVDDAVFHVAVPARQWWDDIVHT